MVYADVQDGVEHFTVTLPQSVGVTASIVSVDMRRLANARRRLAVLEQDAGVVSIGWAVITRILGVIVEKFEHSCSS